GHLVQDWTTFRGALNFLNMWDQVGAVASYVGTCRSRVTLPIALWGTGRTRLPRQLRYATELATIETTLEPRNTWFQNDPSPWRFERYEVTAPTRPLFGHRVPTRHVKILLVDPGSNRQYWHTLGGWEIREAYSVAVGTLHGDAPITDNYPYEYKV